MRTQSWAGLPDHHKRQAARDMLAGEKNWQFYGCVVERPDDDTLRRWAGLAPQSPQAGAESVTSIRAAEPGISQRIAHTREGISSDIAHAREDAGKPISVSIARTHAREGKRQAVDSALTANPDASNREIARITGTTHPFVALRRRLRGNVTA